MNVGMLWFDNDNHAGLASRVARAADYYRTKYGRTPTLCYVHPSMLAGVVEGNTGDDAGEARWMAGDVEVRGYRSLMPNHFWIGIGGAAEGQTGSAIRVEKSLPAAAVAPVTPRAAVSNHRAAAGRPLAVKGTRGKATAISAAAAD